MNEQLEVYHVEIHFDLSMDALDSICARRSEAAAQDNYDY